MEWQVIYDYDNHSSPEAFFLVVGIAIFCFGFLCIWVSQTPWFNKHTEKNRKYFPGIMGLFYKKTPMNASQNNIA